MWLDTVLIVEAAAAFWLAAFNAALLARAASRASAPARRVAALGLACLCSAQACESLLFTWTGAPGGGALRGVHLVVRGALLASTALLSLLLLRGPARR